MAEPLVEEMPRAPKPLWGSSCPPPEPPQAPAEAPATSALEANTKSKGSNAYYYAHASKDWSVPDNAKIISGAGITTGCGPQRLDPEHGEAAEASSPAAGDAALRAEIDRLKSRVSAMAQRRATETPLTKYSFSDSKDNVKVYVEVPPTALHSRKTSDDGDVRNCSDAGIVARFQRRSFTLVIAKPSVDTAVDSVERYKLDISNLRYDVVPAKCTYKLVAEKGRVVVALRKADVLNEWTSLSLKGIL
ncbi:hypothetical protein JL721_680 [Aureococcus anophagefferens]|nr:hypothetical protein JL721_680 [Aureococcus anophagefferens]